MAFLFLNRFYTVFFVDVIINNININTNQYYFDQNTLIPFHNVCLRIRHFGQIIKIPLKL